MLIPNDELRDLSVILATAMPVIAVAFYTVRNAEDGEGSVDSEIVPRGGKWFWRPLATRWGKLVFKFVGIQVAPTADGLKLAKNWRVLADHDFIYRAATGFLSALAPLILGEVFPPLIGRIMLGISLWLVVLSLNALVIYSTTISSIRVARALREAELPTISDGPGSPHAQESDLPKKTAGDMLASAYLVAVGTDLIAVALGVVIAIS